jgi:predicted nuclease of predicted toxin-antitoxin system
VRILLDQGTPAPLRTVLVGHQVSTAHELGWSALSNGELLAAAEDEFDVLVTTDRNLRHQQNLTGRRLSILVLPTTSWPRLRERIETITRETLSMAPGECRELIW